MAITSCDGLDSLEINLTDNHRKRMQYEGGRDEEIQFIDVQTATFGELMQNYPNTHHIDFLSLDIEGGEFEVLKGIDFDRYTFSLMAIEHNFVDSAIEEITRFLKSKGYRMLMFNAWDFFFVPDERIGWEQSYKLKLI